MYRPARRELPRRGDDLIVRQATIHELDPERAAIELRARLAVDQPSVVVFFCAPTYDTAVLGPALARAFDRIPLVGCTSAGQIDASGFQRTGITAIALASRELEATIHRIAPLSAIAGDSAAVAELLRGRRTRAGWRTCALTLVDGLSHLEEQLASSVHEALIDVPSIGGSAADDLLHRGTQVYVDGAFQPDAAAVVLLHTALEFRTFQFHHFEPGHAVLVITEADPARRTVTEINGEPAAEAYARAVGVPVDALSARTFAAHPLLLNLGGEYIARAIRGVDADGGLAFYCAIERGLVTRVGHACDVVETTRRALHRIGDELGEVAAVIGCECVLRRVAFEDAGVDLQIAALYATHGVVAFSGYGEQFNGIHANHTFTGLALGRPR